jgi:hypothetical protein
MIKKKKKKKRFESREKGQSSRIEYGIDYNLMTEGHVQGGRISRNWCMYVRRRSSILTQNGQYPF